MSLKELFAFFLRCCWDVFGGILVGVLQEGESMDVWLGVSLGM